MDMQAVEQIVAKPAPLSLKGEGLLNVGEAKKAFVVQEKKEKWLDNLIKAAEKIISTLKAKIIEIK